MKFGEAVTIGILVSMEDLSQPTVILLFHLNGITLLIGFVQIAHFDRQNLYNYFYLVLLFQDGDWINNTTYCNGKDSKCESELIVTIPKISLVSPGVARHDYPFTEAPVVPQV
jgi:hypothetical protein